MPRMTAIACDNCGKVEFGSTYTGLMHRLRTEGWTKGHKVNTFFCGAPDCRKVRQRIEEAAGNEKRTAKKRCRVLPAKVSS